MQVNKCYQILETCPMWNDGTGIAYTKRLPTIFLSKDEAEKYKEDLEILTCEKTTCLEYEIIELNLCKIYNEENSDILSFNDYEFLYLEDKLGSQFDNLHTNLKEEF